MERTIVIERIRLMQMQEFWKHESKIFKDRHEAGKLLAERLDRFSHQDCIVLALPRGGVPVGFEIAKKLNKPLGVVVSRKIGAPHNPEFGIGAVSENGTVILDHEVIKLLAIEKDQVDLLVKKEEEELARRVDLYRDGNLLPSIKEKEILLVDDGLATGVTARAAIKTLVKLEPTLIVFASPVCSEEAAHELFYEAAGVACLNRIPDMGSVGFYYKNFGQVSDEEVVRLLKRAKKFGGGGNYD